MICLTTGPETVEPAEHELKPWAKVVSFKVFLFSVCQGDGRTTVWFQLPVLEEFSNQKYLEKFGFIANAMGAEYTWIIVIT